MSKNSGEYVKKISIFFVTLIFMLLVSEFAIRLYERFMLNIPFSKSILDYYDPLLGWKGAEIFGDSSTKKYKIFILGDSFTDSGGVSESMRYYNVIKERLNAEIFVYASGGYSTLQEYLALDKYYDQIKPDLVILQVCYNDFFGNSWELESSTFLINFPMVRPYLIKGEIKYLYPRFWVNYRLFFALYSRFLYRLFYAFEHAVTLLIRKKYFNLHTIEDDIIHQGTKLRSFKESVATTELLIQKIKSRAIGIPIIAFAVDDEKPYFEEFKNIFRKLNIKFIDYIPEKIRQREKELGISIRQRDGQHYNDRGQQFCGGLLSEELYRLRYGKKSIY